ncbi:MAG: lipase/acyltransferase domain-containing protein, partial [Candidatus Binatia bacterium]
MAQRSKVKDLVIFIPGMMGSRLLYNGVPIWGDESRTFLAWIRKHGDELARLSIGPDDPELESLGDGITAEGIVEGHFVVGRFLKAGGYGPLLRFLQQGLGLRAGRNLQLFAYDWRRDLRVAARRLATRADGWLRAWQSHSGNDKARVVLVCHAMGGLVGRYYADVEGGWPSVRQIITLGTPFLGSVRALDLLYFGVDFQSYGLPFHDVTPIARTFTSVYQLLPHYPSIHTFTGEVVSPFDIRIPTFEHHKMERSRQLLRDLGEHQSRNRSAEGYAQLRS